MGKTDKRVDNYISKSAEFAKPVLNHFRKIIHSECPEVLETMKWSFPHFEYKGMLCFMASFKNHCAFGFWKAELMKNSQKLFSGIGKTAMGNLGKIHCLDDLPSDKILKDCIREAMVLNENGIKLPTKKKSKIVKEIEIPSVLLTALRKNKTALDAFENFSYSHKKEYIEWITEAKTEVTRDKRIVTAVEWLSEGKSRNWKYEMKTG